MGVFQLLLVVLGYFTYHEGFVLVDAVAAVSREVTPGGRVVSLGKWTAFSSGSSDSGVLGLCSPPLLPDTRLRLRLAAGISGRRR